MTLGVCVLLEVDDSLRVTLGDIVEVGVNVSLGLWVRLALAV